MASIDTYVPPLGIFANEVFQDIDKYINTRPDDE